MLDALIDRLRRRRRERGAAAVEYALLVVGFAAALLTISYALGNVTKAAYSTTCTSVSSPSGTATDSDPNCKN